MVMLSIKQQVELFKKCKGNCLLLINKLYCHECCLRIFCRNTTEKTTPQQVYDKVCRLEELDYNLEVFYFEIYL